LRDRLFIHGEWVGAASGKTFETKNPATGETLASVAEAGPEDVDRAVKSAREALRSDAWRKMSPHRRAELLWKLADLLDANSDEIARLETADNGKPFFESRKVDLPSIVENFRYFAGLADKIEGQTIPVAGAFLNYTLREPIGVVGCIVPWNFPLSLAAWKVAPALACGNAVVLKPAEETPLTALRLGELALEAGFPPGVLNVVPGFGESAGAALVRHPGVDAISFTGSTEVGKIVMREAAETLKKVSLELGGKSPNIVFADADIPAAVRGATTGIFYGMGEVCAAGSRVLVERSVYEQFVEEFKGRALKMPAGDPMDPKSRLGRDRQRAAARARPGLHRIGQARGRAAGRRWRAHRRERQGQLRQRHGLRGRHARDEHRQGGDLRARRSGDPVRGPGRRGLEGQPDDLRARRGRVDAGRGQGAPGRERAARGHRVGEHLQPVRLGLPVRRLQAERLRP
jgi:acyl-CoA reductase-like NAD-dependent aldehyde dehydrogenase